VTASRDAGASVGQEHGLQEAWQATDSARQRGGQQQYKENYVNGQKHGIQEAWQATDAAQRRGGRQEYKDNKYYLDGIDKSQWIYQSYIRGLASEVQATANFEERGLSGIIAGYLLP
jgi:hypothetical protein